VDLVKVRTGIEGKFFDMSSDVVKENGFVLYDMEYIAGSSTLRVYIMNIETKTADIDDCVKVTRAMNPFFEEESELDVQWIPSDIVLEVSSPGMFRSIKTKEHFELALNERVQCSISGKLEDALIVDAPKAVKKGNGFVGILKEVKEDKIILDIDGFQLPLTFDQIKKANLEPEV
jgi:ribosome maturation factor RimP